MQRWTGVAAQAEAERLLAVSREAIEATLAPFEPTSTFSGWFETLRGIEELINLVLGFTDDDALADRIQRLPLVNPQHFAQALLAIRVDLAQRFSAPVASRLCKTLAQVQALAFSFALYSLPAAQEMLTVGGAVWYLQSRRRHLLALLHTIPGTCRGSRPFSGDADVITFVYLMETAGLGTTSMHHNLMLARVYPNFTLDIDSMGAQASHAFPALDRLFLEPERAALTEMVDMDLSGLRRLPVSRNVIFSAAEVENNLSLIAAMLAEFHLQETSYGALAAFIRRLLPAVSDEYFVRLSAQRFDALCASEGLPEALKKALVVANSDFVHNTSTYAPFTRVGSELVSSVTLLTRFANHWKNVCLNRVRRFQIRSGFIFEKSVKAALREQGFAVTNIKRCGHAEFDVVATLDGVIYNVQCKNNLVDLHRIETDVKRFVRYNRSLERSYQRALDKERAREGVLLRELSLSTIKHFVVSRFPIATDNPRVLAFGEIDRFRAMAESAQFDLKT